jgi:hypothetical protein
VCNLERRGRQGEQEIDTLTGDLQWNSAIHAHVTKRMRCLLDCFVCWRNCSCYASVWHWQRKAAGGRRNGVSEAVRQSGAANDRWKQARLRFFVFVRDERALHGCAARVGRGR